MSLWEFMKSWFVSNRHQILSVPIADPHATVEFEPEESYFGLWLTHGFLKREKAWLKKYYPASHVSVRLDVAGETRTLTRLARPAVDMVGPGVWTDFPITGLLPYNGGVVEVEAGLSALETSTVLGAAVNVIDDFSGLVVPPVSEALKVANKVASSVQTLLDAGKGDVFLGTHQAYTAAGGGGENQLKPGYLAVIGAAHGELEADNLSVEGSILRVRDGNGTKPLEGFNYLLFRIEARQERDDWRFAGFDESIRRAKEALFAGEERTFERHRDDVLSAVINSPDLTRPDRARVAMAIRDEINEAISLGAGATAEHSRSLGEIVSRHAIARNDPRVAMDLTLRDLLDGTV